MEHISKTEIKLPEAVESRSIPQSSECVCGGDGWIKTPSGVKRCICAKLRRYQKQLEQIPERFRGSSLENYVPMDAMQSSALAILFAKPHGNYFLHGLYGRGKTHLATAQYKTMIEAGQSCAFRSMGELLAELTAAVIRDETSQVIQRARYSDSFHLFIDDVDKFKSTEFKHEALFDLVDTLYKRKLGLTITSNYGLGMLSETERLHPAIVRRIDDMCVAVSV